MGRQIRLEGVEVDVHEWWSTLVAREHRQVPDFLECERRSVVTTCRVESVCRTNVTEIIINKNNKGVTKVIPVKIGTIQTIDSRNRQPT